MCCCDSRVEVRRMRMKGYRTAFVLFCWENELVFLRAGKGPCRSVREWDGGDGWRPENSGARSGTCGLL